VYTPDTWHVAEPGAFNVNALPESNVLNLTTVGVSLAVAYWFVESDAAMCGIPKTPPPTGPDKLAK
jgi:hypothetical protein